MKVKYESDARFRRDYRATLPHSNGDWQSVLIEHRQLSSVSVLNLEDERSDEEIARDFLEYGQN